MLRPLTDQTIEALASPGFARDVDSELQAEAMRTEPDYAGVFYNLTSIPAHVMDAKFEGRANWMTPHLLDRLRLLHAAVGMVTESAEYADQIKKHIFYGKPLDKTNLLEEDGDLTWYQRIGRDVLRTTGIQVMVANIQKLRKRYPIATGFTSDAAVKRDLDGERSILEQSRTHNRD